ncbi:Max-binding protein MNT like protein [Argiope bruennichi]|uniref:Max-binding protein MNT n=1 Tax=Argiope bruennichi TaxID=94029 RepID=A0A8T0FLT8_ARGBR|nr:Max-binding protein MNT like protein [Argiope bruennichi]
MENIRGPRNLLNHHHLHNQKDQHPLMCLIHHRKKLKKKRRTTSLSKDSSHEHSGTGTREVHNKLEKNRRAHLKECFEMLKKQLPNMDDRKTSNLSILRNAIRFIQNLKRKERESEHELERLAREKISFQQRLSTLKKEVANHLDAYMEGNNLALQDDNDETTTTASEGPSVNDLDDLDLPSASAATSDFASSSSSSTTNSVLVGPIPSTAAVSLAFTKPMITGAQISVPNKESIASPNHFMPESRIITENKTTLSSASSPVSVQITSADGVAPTATRVFSAGNLHTMTPIFAAPSGMQLISQPSGIKVITAPNSIMTSNSSVQHISVNHHPHHGQIHVLTPSSNASYASSIVSTKSFTDSLVQMASGSAKGIQKPHLVSNLLVSPQTMVELSHGNSGNSNSTNLSDITSSGISNSLNLSQNVVKANSVLSGNMAIAVKNNLANNMSTSTPSNMITALHVSKPHSQVIQPTLTSSIITQGGSQVNNGNHHGVTTNLKPITSNHTVRSLPHIAGIAHVVSQSPISASVGQIVTPGNHMSGVTPLAGSVSVVSHTGAVLQQPLGKVISPVLKQVNSIPILQPQFLQQVSVGSSNQQIVKPVVVVSMPNVVQGGNISSLTPTSLVTMNEQTGVVRGSVSQK